MLLVAGAAWILITIVSVAEHPVLPTVSVTLTDPITGVVHITAIWFVPCPVKVPPTTDQTNVFPELAVL